MGTSGNGAHARSGVTYRRWAARWMLHGSRPLMDWSGKRTPSANHPMTPLANEQCVCVPLHRKKERFGFECGQRASHAGASPLRSEEREPDHRILSGASLGRPSRSRPAGSARKWFVQHRAAVPIPATCAGTLERLTSFAPVTFAAWPFLVSTAPGAPRGSWLWSGAWEPPLALALSPNAARAAAAQDWPPFVLVSGLLLVGLVAEEDGLFAAAGAWFARLAPNGFLLYGGAAVLVAAVTTVLNLDTSVSVSDPGPRLHRPTARSG